MRVKDEVLWHQQLSEFDVDESSRKFRDFLVFWLDAADGLVSSSKIEITPRDALSKAFVLAEQTFGYLSVEWLAQMLLVVVQHWFNGDEVWEQLSVWEQRLVEQAVALKLAELQESANLSVDEPQDEVDSATPGVSD